ncbi:hypothetical protein CGLAU_02815 [Corynebacterium glaucum]|uniref:DUF3499 domain-containing protein n=1 Tax=Corynebacterium glaucum TaxID=187491 RepID=A0A1Q2HUM2_9CORY|nr:hypothetical protein CGLAU_02815 [Corynebacterium glaucum]WJZ07077.1 hypothetical protein CGLAUT_02855 [Corynebacterium glaucum]
MLRLALDAQTPARRTSTTQNSSRGLDLASVNTFRRCCRPGCGRPAVATLVYAYAESTAVVGPLAPVADPHAWDLCERHSAHITAPVGWEMVRVEQIDITDDELDAMDDADLTALAEAVREAGRVTTGLVDTSQDPIEYGATHDFNDPETSNHPVHRTKRVEEQAAADRAARRSHLRIVPDPADPSATNGASASTRQDPGGQAD